MGPSMSYGHGGSSEGKGEPVSAVFTSHVDTTDYTESGPGGVHYHVLREGGPDDGMVSASVAECGAFHQESYVCVNDEFILGVSGELLVEFSDRDPVRVGEGDILVLTKGTVCTLIVESTFRWVYVTTRGVSAG
jgi:uncharacterized cupin superfamily protein